MVLNKHRKSIPEIRSAIRHLGEAQKTFTRLSDPELSGKERFEPAHAATHAKFCATSLTKTKDHMDRAEREEKEEERRKVNVFLALVQYLSFRPTRLHIILSLGYYVGDRRVP